VPKQRELPEGESGAWKPARVAAATESEASPHRVLVVDDDHDVRDALCRMLSLKGYGFFAAVGPAEAIALFQARHSEIDAVVTDLVMPGMNGLQLAKELAKVRDVPTIVVSGASDSLLEEHGLIGAENFLAKPVLPDALDAKLRELLEKQSTQGLIA
jgi:DNA-binding NtrC family response regulator